MRSGSATCAATSTARALHLGAFGWVENVRPAIRRAARTTTRCHAALRDAAGRPVFEDAANGGYVHAPSLTQAATAAVLRNGYLSHADSAAADDVRGQPVVGAHACRAGADAGRAQRTADRRAARLSARARPARRSSRRRARRIHRRAARSVSAGVGPADARSPPGTPRRSGRGAQRRRRARPGRSHGRADLSVRHRRAARRRHAEPARRSPPKSIACATRSMRCPTCCWSESVHQAVQGNLTRTNASLQALTAPDVPPEPEIIRTPRSGRVLTFRVALALDADGDERVDRRSCRRARAPIRSSITGSRSICRRRRDSSGRCATASPMPRVQSLAGIGLEPIDVVLMSGDGSAISRASSSVISCRAFAWATPCPTRARP